MIKFNKNQFLLLIFGLILVIVTYLIYPKNNQIVEEKDLNSNIAETENTFENISYTGFDNKGNTYEIGSKFAEIKSDDPDITLMKQVTAYIYVGDRTVMITSDFGSYNKAKQDMLFRQNVEMIEGLNTTKSDNLDIINTENYVTIYNNVFFINEESAGQADKVEVDLTTRNSKISMYESNERIQVSLKR